MVKRVEYGYLITKAFTTGGWGCDDDVLPGKNKVDRFSLMTIEAGYSDSFKMFNETGIQRSCQIGKNGVR